MARTKSLLLSALGGALVAFILDPDRGRARRAKAWEMTLGRMRKAGRRVSRTGRFVGAEMYGLKQKGLKAKVESEVFRNQSIPKGGVNVNVVDGCVFLRGQVESPRQIQQLENAVRKINGVREVRNLLHLIGSPPRSLEETAKPRHRGR